MGYHPLALMPPPKSTPQKTGARSSALAPVPARKVARMQPGVVHCCRRAWRRADFGDTGRVAGAGAAAAGAGLVMAGLLHEQAGAVGAGVVAVVELFESFIIFFVSIYGCSSQPSFINASDMPLRKFDAKHAQSPDFSMEA
jgi:hypothetical protein